MTVVPKIGPSGPAFVSSPSAKEASGATPTEVNNGPSVYLTQRQRGRVRCLEEFRRNSDKALTSIHNP